MGQGNPTPHCRHYAHHCLPVYLWRAPYATDAPAFIADEGLEGQFPDHVQPAESQAGGLSGAQVFGRCALKIGPEAYVAADQV